MEASCFWVKNIVVGDIFIKRLYALRAETSPRTMQIKEFRPTWRSGWSIGFAFLISSVDYSKSIYMTFIHEILGSELGIATNRMRRVFAVFIVP